MNTAAAAPANADDRSAIATSVDAVQEATAAHGLALEVVRLPEAEHGFVLPPHRWMVERPFGRMARSRRPARDDGRLPGTLAGLHPVAFVVLLLRGAADFAPVRHTLHTPGSSRPSVPCQPTPPLLQG